MNNIIDEIQKSNNIVLLCHENPDGDALGSIIAMYHALKSLNKKVDMIARDMPSKFTYLAGFQDIKSSSDKSYDLAIILDTPKLERVNSSFILDQVKKIVVIDHHLSNSSYGDINYVEQLPSCCELVYHLLKQMNIKIDELIANALCTGILTDTVGLSTENVSSPTYQIIWELSQIINVPKIYKKALGTITKKEFELKKIATANLEFYKEGQIAVTHITDSDLQSVGLTQNDDGILSRLGKEIQGVEVYIYIRNYQNRRRVSLRSNNVDVNAVASLFGGGGHILAAGIVTDMSYSELKSKLIEEIGKEIDKWYSSSK